MRSLGGPLLFVLLPVLVLELPVRLVHRNMLQRFEQRLSAERIDVVLVGSSRVAAAFDANVLEQEWSKVFGRSIAVSNLGRGYSRPQDKFFAFRHLFEKHAAHVKGAWLLIEAPQGIPDHADWKSPWAVEQEPGLITTYLGWRDYVNMVRDSETAPSVKVQVGIYSIFRSALAMRKVRDAIDTWGQSWKPSFLAEQGRPMDMTQDGGILQNTGALVEEAKPGMHSQRIALPEFRVTVWASVMELAKSHGMRVAFFEVPMAPSDARQVRRGYPAGVSMDGRAPVLSSPSHYRESDFPDGLHLRQSLMSEVSRNFAQAFREAFPDAF